MQKARDGAQIALSEAEVALRTAKAESRRTQQALDTALAEYAASDPNDLTQAWTTERERVLSLVDDLKAAISRLAAIEGTYIWMTHDRQPPGVTPIESRLNELTWALSNRANPSRIHVAPADSLGLATEMVRVAQ